MTVLTNGAELKRFYSDDSFWPVGAWHEYIELEINGKIDEIDDIESISDESKVKILSGIVNLKDPPEDGDIVTIESFFRKWRKIQNTKQMVVDIPKEAEEQFRELMKLNKWKII